MLPRRPLHVLIRQTVTLETMERKSKVWKWHMMRQMTNRPKLLNPLKRQRNSLRKLRERIMLMEEEDKKGADALCTTITKLALTSKSADNVLKAVKIVESTCMNNEVTIEELDKNLRATNKMAVD